MVTDKRIVAIIVARMGSSRVPGKSIIELCGKPVIWHMLEIAKRIKYVDEVCLATTDLEQDDVLAEIARSSNVKCFRGHSENVLDRIYGAATETNADIIVDIGGDCPLLDSTIIEQAIENFAQYKCDYLCNYEPPTFPEGFDVNIITMTALTNAFNNAIAPSQRIHPFSYITYHKENFVVRNFSGAQDLSRHHWSLDFPEDIEFIKMVYSKIWQENKIIRMSDVLELIDKYDEISNVDAKLKRPKVQHAFWNSPGIIRDMNTDIASLTKSAQSALDEKNFTHAKHCYDEIITISKALLKGTKFLE